MGSADCHQAASFYQFPNGDVMLCWVAYEGGEGSEDMVTLYSVSRDRGITWSDPQVYMADHPLGPPWVLMLRLQDGLDTLMFGCQTRCPPEKYRPR